MTTTQRVHCIVVNYRTPALAEACLASLAEERRTHVANLRATVVDNASGDGSAERLAAVIARERWGDWVALRASARNGGFAAGNNIAIRELLHAQPPPDFVYLLNPDARVLPGAVDALVQFLEQHPNAGIAGSRICDDQGRLQHSAFRFPNAWDEFARGIQLGVIDRLVATRLTTFEPASAPTRCDWASGAALMIRGEVLQRVGLMDEGYFLDYEETDFCQAARACGFECWFVPESGVIHHVAQAKRAARASPRQPSYWFESRRRYFIKNHGRGYAMLADLAWLAGHLGLRARRLFLRRSTSLPPRFLSDFLHHSAIHRSL